MVTPVATAVRREEADRAISHVKLMPGMTSFRWIIALASVLSCVTAGAAQTPETVRHFLTEELGPGQRDGVGSEARFSAPAGLAVDGTGAIVIADSGNQTIRIFEPDGEVATVAGFAGESGSADGFDASARFSTPAGVAIGPDGRIWVADAGNHTIRCIDPTGVVKTVAGRAGTRGSTDGTGTNARFQNPRALVVAGDGRVYVADTGNHVIRRIDANGQVSTLAGKAGVAGASDGTGSSARFSSPRGIAIGPDGTLFVADSGNHTLRRLTPDGVVSTLAGTPGTAGSSDGRGGQARFNGPSGIAATPSGALVVADEGNNTIRRVSPQGRS